ncbi:protein Lines homolog 1 isoform X1 [Canis lupus familiaris]|uniref:protein Lines homolog 1 isoform X1 n=1 Tax=Canis lupus familiaris TaxID=9615 RepID=UPI0018F71095|nr:protein Lines homolog 1 isoform X1 [Canis lupus familiaris]XP_038388572.1 protein Lines homolog 1 isoform X1 [Canis lupus familiaris]XP_038388573.1 protein Lines homolog 1 isoform X1 [Canis lupus familiaris]XP_038388574.1 protein Lines homolog 1 isoform X1 [Canis lupus familiaris]XP_038388575.1 protein Lines homolog 1 isoform X1 [Canis lupus familiaris]XP_038388576.1 protein Lines homolog 1 isoform X1 [Canis lupus familiaris]XP_038388577.1 protein Lines homolog 1 isoform X1 [Canis lupus fa
MRYVLAVPMVPMKAFFDILEQLYKKVLLGATLENESHDYIFYLNPASLDLDCSTTTSSECSNHHDVQGRHQPSSANLASISVVPVRLKKHSPIFSAREITLLQLTVIKVMITRILSAETDSHAKEKYRDVIKILLKSSDIDSKLTCLFQNSDKLLCHMAAKCLALLLYFQLREKITLSNSWVAFCQKNLSEYPENEKVVYCLWTLTVIIKEIFKDTCSQKTEILKQFLTPFDTIFQVFYTSLFSLHFKSCQDTSKIINSMICSLELLELLIASRIHLKLHFTCQRILFLKPSCVLDVITWPVEAFVKRKFIIFIKKCLLWKVGEDLCWGSGPALMPPDQHLDVDMLALADAVLQAVDLGLLKTLSVRGKPPCFGGDEVQPACECVHGPDHVILRAASLLIIKSLEIKFQSCASANEIKVDLQSFMSELLTFLKPHLQPSLQSHNPCEWISRVFIEQDDDMLEAAKASLGIYLKLTRQCKATEGLTQEKEMWNHHTHKYGYNPHCIFLFLLKNIGFDSSVLLDFLISSETCFLEYFVRYLKLLQKDGASFFTICKYFDVTELKDSINICGCSSSLVQDRSSNQTELSLWAALGSHRNAHASVPWASNASGPLNQPVMSKEPHVTLQAAAGLSPPQASQSLVDYDSSDDSEVEVTDQHSTNSKQTSLQQEAKKKFQDTVRTGPDEKELSMEPQSRPLVPEQSNINIPFSVDCDISKVGISYRTLKCFQELQGAIYRLQKKNLFPYNATALLKLLKHTESIYNESMNSL